MIRNRNTVMKITTFVILFILAGTCAAGQFNDVMITSIAVDSYGIARVTISGGTEVNPPPQCTSDSSKLTYDLNGLSGSGWHSMVLAAQAAQRKIHIIGKNSCLALWNSTPYEEVDTLYILSQ